MRLTPDHDDLSVAIVGFGYVGSCLGVTLAELGLRVVGIDNDAALVRELTSGRCRFGEPGLAQAFYRLAGSLHVSDDYKGVAEADVVIITVGTPIDESGSLVTRALEDVCRRLSSVLRPGALVILKSTVSPGTTRQVVLPLLEAGGLVEGRDFALAYCPERLAEGAALRQLRTLPMIVGGCRPESTAAAAAFWAKTLAVRTIAVSSPEAAEIVKLADNWWIDANIAIANELAQVCAVFGVDALEVIGGANTLPKGTGTVNLLLPSVGVGGSCLPKDPWMLWRAARDKGVQLRTVEIARSVNDAMPRYAFEVLREGLAELGKDIATATVAVLGLAHKNDTGDLRMTPVKPVVDALRAAGATVTIFDPLVAAAAAEATIGLPAAGSIEDATTGADCVAVLAGHRPFVDLDFTALAARVAAPCLVLDGRAYYPPATIERLRRLGFAYRGIGR